MAFFLNSGVLYRIAQKAYERTASAESDTAPDQLDALTALLFSAATLEAFIMELALLSENGARTCPAPSPVHLLAPILQETEVSHGSVRLKYLLAKAILSGQAYDKGGRPYQDFDLLFTIRDAIVHLKPDEIKEKPHKIVARLSSRGLCEKENPKSRSTWLHHITTRAVARWACNVMRDMEDSIRDSFPNDMVFGTRHFDGVN
ncbi:MAG: hypothetical protein WBE26_02945 [Phycisphaerae bacterium]